MRTHKPFAVFPAIACCLPLLLCSPTGNAGNSTQVGNPGRVAGLLYEPDGKTPAAGVRVAIRPRTSLADTAVIGLGKRTADTATVITDDSGRFAFDSTLDTGTYVIEAASGNDAVLIDPVVVTDEDAADTLPPDTLKPMGAIKGVISLSEGGDPRKVFVLAFGIDRFAKVEADGSFRFSGLAEGNYDLRLISSLNDYGVLDTNGNVVTSGDTLDMDTIDLPFTGIPTVKNVTISYDTLKQIVTLSWERADTGLVKGYNVYRRSVDSNTVLARINVNPVADMVYRDSTGVQDETYEYRVACVDTNAMEGTKSAGNSIIVMGLFRAVDTIGVRGTASQELANPSCVARGPNGYVVIDIFSDTAAAKLYDTSGTYLSSFIIRAHSTGWCFCDYGKNGNLFTVFNDTAFEFDRIGNLLSTYPLLLGTQDEIYLQNQTDTVLLYAISSQLNQVIIISIFGDTLSLFSVTEGYHIVADRNRNVYILGKSKIYRYDFQGNLTNSWGSQGLSRGQFSNAALIAVDTMDRIYVFENPNNRLQIFSQNGDLQGLFRTYVPNTPRKLVIDKANICILDNNTAYKLFIYNKIQGTILP
ncbi:MAG: hypothetical protein JW913_04865 [Chitinispirillaceae bacterium]|nr:hypothetical protein [Chitinispirillaceae bacterium]